MSSNQISSEQDKDSLFNASMVNMLSSDIKEVLERYLLESLLLKYVSNEGQTVFGANQVNSGLLNSSFSLSQLGQEKRRDIIAPIPLYPNCEPLGLKTMSRDRTESLSTARGEGTPKDTHVLSPTKVVENDIPSQVATPSKKKSKQKLKLIKMDLAFENEGGELATRCDVVYKTILRDFRRFFLEGYKAFNAAQPERHGMEDTLLKYIITLLPNCSVEQCKTISLDLGCLLFPKEMTKDVHILDEMERRGHFDCDRQQISSEIMRIHGFLYKFSIDKIEECFSNPSLCQLFDFYVEQTGDERISSNPTMAKNASIYLKARKILIGKACDKLAKYQTQ